jgi:hypothetical protein
MELVDVHFFRGLKDYEVIRYYLPKFVFIVLLYVQHSIKMLNRLDDMLWGYRCGFSTKRCSMKKLCT